MSSKNPHELGQSLRDLRALEAIEECPEISQRALAQHLGIAVGLTNACLKTMAAKGLIKISRINGRKLAYVLTPAGFAEKARISLDYAQHTIGFYKRAKQEVGKSIAALVEQGVARVALYGANDLAEIVSIVCGHSGIDVVKIVDEDPARQRYAMLGLAVEPPGSLESLDFEAIVVANLEDADASFERAKAIVGDRVTIVRAM